MSSRTGWLILVALALMLLPYIVVWIGQSGVIAF
jgi:hypothetical protein